jgi:predicted HAD superfamily Cof-like phosphohydrolase
MDSFQLIKDWRTSFGLPVRTELTMPSQEELKLALDLIKEEHLELKVACAQRLASEENCLPFNEVADAIGDLYFVVTQLACVMGFNPDELIQKVYDSNMSKLCETEEEANLTIDWYDKNKAIKAYKNQLENGKFVIRNSETNKVLKGLNFKEPDWQYEKEIDIWT